MLKLTPEEINKLYLRCMQCCITLAIPTDTEDIDFYKTRGLIVKTIKTLRGNRNFIILEHPCQHLTTAGCAIYKNRPQNCIDYIGTYDQFLDRCDLRNFLTEKE